MVLYKEDVFGLGTDFRGPSAGDKLQQIGYKSCELLLNKAV